MPPYKQGLIVGKFCPLHKGHLRLIERAQAQCETLLIISYTNPEFEGCGPARRAAWLKRAAPDAKVCVLGHDLDLSPPVNDAPDNVHRAFTANLCAEYFTVSPDAVFTSEAYGDGFAAYLSTYFDKTVTHIAVDPERASVPISATQIRSDVFGHKEFLPVYVYKDFIQSVLLLGGESTGKSTMTQYMAQALGEPYVEEYGRTLWEQQNGELSFDDYMKIAETHIQSEDEARTRAARYIFVDTSPLTTLFYGLEQFGRVAPELHALANRPYDYVFLAHPDFPMVQDGTRQDETFRRRQHVWYKEQLKDRDMAYRDLKGSFWDKIETIKDTLIKTG